MKLDPNNVYVLNNYSYYLSLRAENLEKAKAMSSKSNNIAPNQPSFQDTYAWILFQLKEYEEANVWIDKALSNNSKSPVLLEHKGDILYFLNKKEEAVQFWKKAKDANGKSEVLDRKIRRASGLNKYLVILLISVVLFACKSREKASRKPLEGKKTEYLLNQLKLNEFQFETISSKAEFTICRKRRKPLSKRAFVCEKIVPFGFL